MMFLSPIVEQLNGTVLGMNREESSKKSNMQSTNSDTNGRAGMQRTPLNSEPSLIHHHLHIAGVDEMFTTQIYQDS